MAVKMSVIGSITAPQIGRMDNNCGRLVGARPGSWTSILTDVELYYEVCDGDSVFGCVVPACVAGGGVGAGNTKGMARLHSSGKFSRCGASFREPVSLDGRIAGSAAPRSCR